MTYLDRVVSDPSICHGKACIRGTRIAVADILHLLSAGYPMDEIPTQYPGITRQDVLAAIAFATRLSEEPVRILTTR